jgi:hypothetical protein
MGGSFDRGEEQAREGWWATSFAPVFAQSAVAQRILDYDN